jgi:hypothetical protein
MRHSERKNKCERHDERMGEMDLNVKVVADASGVEGTNKSLQQRAHEGRASHVTRHTPHVTRHTPQ